MFTSGGHHPVFKGSDAVAVWPGDSDDALEGDGAH